MDVIIFIGIKRHRCLNATFNNISAYMVVVSFIDAGNQSAWRQPPTCRKSLTNCSYNKVESGV
jgi:predicted glycosyltransferase involved in capsule biosynthesis